MAAKFAETLNINLPAGTRERLTKIAARRYLTPVALARVAVMEMLERATKEETKAA
jgi:predicted transcriptional regulator